MIPIFRSTIIPVPFFLGCDFLPFIRYLIAEERKILKLLSVIEFLVSNLNKAKPIGTSSPEPPVPAVLQSASNKNMTINPQNSYSSNGKSSLCTHYPVVVSGL